MNKHIRILQVLDWVLAALVGLTMLVVIASAIATVVMLDSLGEAGKEIVALTVGLNGGTIALMVLMLVLLATSALRLRAGKGRLLQSFLAVLSIINCPVGTAFAAYSLWVLWINEETTAHFSGGEPASPAVKWMAALAAGGVILVGGGAAALVAGLSILMAIPLDPATVADQHPPIEDRSGRVLDPSRCGLNQRRTAGGCETLDGLQATERLFSFASGPTEKGIAELYGTLSVPAGISERRPGVVIVHGSGPAMRDGESPGDLIARYDPKVLVYKRLAEELSAQGLVVLRYDKRSSPPYHDKGLDLTSFAFSDFVDDARDGLDFLAAQPEVDPAALVVLGHSQGGQLAPHIAHGDDRVAAVVLVGGSTQTLGHLMIEQLERLGQVRKTRFDYLSQLLTPLATGPIRTCFEPIWANDFDPDARCFAGLRNQVVADYETLAQTTPELLADLDAPVMAIQGTCDINIDPAEIPRMQSVMAGRDAEFHYVHGLDHSLTNLVEPLDPADLDPGALQRVSAFLASVPWTTRSEHEEAPIGSMQP